MDLASLPNPYNYRNPVRKPALFAGRTGEISAIKYELQQATVDQPTSYVAVHGQRAAGKTSLLNQAEHIARSMNILPVRVELVPSDTTPIAFYRKVYEELVATIAAASTIDMPTPVTPTTVRRILGGTSPAVDFPLEFPEALALAGPDGAVPESALRADLTYFVQSIKMPIVLLIDEAHLIAGDPDVLSILRALGNRLNGFVIVLAGTSDLLGRIVGVFSPLLRQFREIKIERFVEHADISSCILQPLKEIGLNGGCFEDFRSVVSEVSRLTDGNPYEIQLYCHEMFARYQMDPGSNMSLTTELLEGVRSRMEAGRNILDRPLIRLARSLSPKRLDVFNALCAGLGHVTVDEAWFAYRLLGDAEVSKEYFYKFRNQQILDDVLVDSDVIDLTDETELFDEVYARLWTISKGKRGRKQLMGRRTFKQLLTANLAVALAEISAKAAPARLLEKCCVNMKPRELEIAIEIFSADSTEDGLRTPIVAQSLHYEILTAGVPKLLDIAAVHCTFEETTAVQWVCSSGVNDFDLSKDANFCEFARRVRSLNGELSIDVQRVKLKTHAQISEWERSRSAGIRHSLSHSYISASFSAYESGLFDAALSYFERSFELDPSWTAANNAAYVSLLLMDADSALLWADVGLKLSGAPENVALTSYNAAMAHLLNRSYGTARQLLMKASEDVKSAPLSRYQMRAMVVPLMGRAGVSLKEEPRTDLVFSIKRALKALGSIGTDEPVLVSPVTGSALKGQDMPSLRAVSSGSLTPTSPSNLGDSAEASPKMEMPSRNGIVLVVATEWSSTHGGLSTFNRNLCIALARAGAQVFCLVLTADEVEIAAAGAEGVTLVRSASVPGAPEYSQLIRRPNLPNGIVPDLIIGHSRITGPAALSLGRDFFERARRLHFIHMAPDEIEWHKLDRGTDRAVQAEQRTTIERELGEQAHRLVAVGPRLHNRFIGEISEEHPTPLRINPGFDLEDSALRRPPGGSPLKVLLVGRTEDAQLKGIDLAARACGLVHTWRERAGTTPISLVMRGAPADIADAQRAALVDWALNPKLEIIVRSYSADQLLLSGDIKRAALVIMPSRSEGFGLVGVEAITMGVPVLVSESSGLAELLREVLDVDTSSRCIVPMSGNDDEDASTWARAIDAALRDLPTSFKQANDLRLRLAGKVTWSAAASALLAEIPAN
ncbi:glycosyltransferase [Streptacidiphilus sp. EB129]|uniref:glycosyltransferase n=1 Tax=Streptacidiphilus sp. EB129 TaxID=3156262 RepID=UPI003517F005